jgi:hypothetical protein
MKSSRNILIKKVMTLFTVAIFFNMNLFLAEVEALRLLQDRKMVENIAKLIAGAANEEEKDIAGANNAEEGHSVTNEIDLLFIHHNLESLAVIITKKTHWVNSGAKLLKRSQEMVTPPPKA